MSLVGSIKLMKVYDAVTVGMIGNGSKPARHMQCSGWMISTREGKLVILAHSLPILHPLQLGCWEQSWQISRDKHSPRILTPQGTHTPPMDQSPGPSAPRAPLWTSSSSTRPRRQLSAGPARWFWPLLARGKVPGDRWRPSIVAVKETAWAWTGHWDSFSMVHLLKRLGRTSCSWWSEWSEQMWAVWSPKTRHVLL